MKSIVSPEPPSVRKEWRCWDISFVFRERTGVVEFVFNLELKLDRTDREKTSHRTQEAEWYPWRGEEGF